MFYSPFCDSHLLIIHYPSEKKLSFIENVYVFTGANS